MILWSLLFYVKFCIFILWDCIYMSSLKFNYLEYHTCFNLSDQYLGTCVAFFSYSLKFDTMRKRWVLLSIAASWFFLPLFYFLLAFNKKCNTLVTRYQNVVLGRIWQHVGRTVHPLAKMVSVIIQMAIVLVDARMVIKDICVKEVSL
jgi:hypothetical protein